MFVFKDGLNTNMLLESNDLLVSVIASSVSSMEVLVAQQINALNGTMVKISCTFTSCYKLDISKFAMNWTYQETKNDSEKLVRKCLACFLVFLYVYCGLFIIAPRIIYQDNYDYENLTETPVWNIVCILCILINTYTVSCSQYRQFFNCLDI